MFRTLLRRVHVGAVAIGPVAAIHLTRPPTLCVSKHDAAQKAKEEEARRAQYDEAMAWCKAEEKTAYAASVRKSEDGQSFLWPFISECGLRNRILGKVRKFPLHRFIMFKFFF